MLSDMSRECTKGRCKQPAVYVLTYDYDEQIAVLGPVPPEPEPRAYELCLKHAKAFVAPEGWQTIRHVDLKA